MTAYVTDTHALIWHLTADAQLSTACREIFEAADRGEATIWIPAIVSDVPDMPDRIVAATALKLGLPLLTRDRKIRLALGTRALW